MSEITIKQNDTARKLSDALTIDGVAVNLAGAAVVLVFHEDGGEPVRRNASIVDEDAGTVEYQFVAEDTAEARTVFFEWEVTFPAAAGVLTFPSNAYHQLNVMKDLD